jgi:fermentation-respiration switch protein FrsA (DUF1100 family)
MLYMIYFGPPKLTWHRICWSVCLLAATLLTALAVDLAGVKREHFLAGRGVLRDASESALVQRNDGSSVRNVRLVSHLGFEVRLRILLPVEASVQEVPLVLLIGGHRTGKKAVDLIGEPRGIAYAAIDYPYTGNHSLSGFCEIAMAIPAIQSAFLDTPPALRLAMDWLEQQSWFDKGRAELVGVSLGVPFAAVAGALDERFSRVWLIHGALDNYTWVMHAAHERIRNKHLRSILVRSALFLAYGNSFRTADWVQEIAPRPVVIVAASADERVPLGSANAYVETAGAGHVDVIWTKGRHVGPDREYELRQLVEIVAGRVRTRPATEAEPR